MKNSLYFLLFYGVALTSMAQPLETLLPEISQRIFSNMEPYRQVPKVKVYEDTRGNLVGKFRNQPHPEIGISESALAICRSLGKDSVDALACIVGHELAHYHLHHAHWRAKDDYNSFEEEQADYVGLWYAYIAGYQSFEVFPELLDRLKQRFPIGDAQQRIAVSARLSEHFYQLYLIHQAATFLTAAEQFENAHVLNQYLQSQLSAPMIENNLAYLRIKILLKQSSLQSNYQFPLYWDQGQQFQQSFGGGRSLDDPQLQQELRSIRLSLEFLLLRRPTYLPALVNLSCIEVISQQWQEADGWMQKGIDLYPNEVAWQILKLIREMESGLKQEGLKGLRDINHPLALANYNLAGQADGSATFEVLGDWANQFLDYFESEPNANRDSLLSIIQLPFEFIKTIGDTYPVSIASGEAKGQSIFKVITQEGVFYFTKDQLPSPLDQGVGAYGFWLAQNEQMLYIDQQNRVTRYSYFLSPY